MLAGTLHGAAAPASARVLAHTRTHSARTDIAAPRPLSREAMPAHAARVATACLHAEPGPTQPLVRPATKLVVVNFPHNPSGATLSPADFHAVVDLCRTAGAYLFSDEMYRMLGERAGAGRAACGGGRGWPARRCCGVARSEAQAAFMQALPGVAADRKCRGCVAQARVGQQ